VTAGDASSGGNELFRKAKSFAPRAVVRSSIVAEKTEGFVLVTASNGLWKYDLEPNRWFYVDSTPFYSTLVKTAIYSNISQMYIVVTLPSDQFELEIYNFRKREWATTAVSYSIGRDPYEMFENHHVALYARDSSRLLFYGGVRKGCVQYLWELHNESDTWKWSRIDGPRASPMALEEETVIAKSVNCVGSSLYVLVTRKGENELWELSLNAMTWTHLENLDVGKVKAGGQIQTTILHSSIFLLMYPFSWKFELVLRIIAYDINKNHEMFLRGDYYDEFRQNLKIPQTRTDFSVAPVNDTSLILYGGKSLYNGYLCDFWICKMTSQDTPLYWYRLQNNCTTEDSNRPPPRAGYKATVINNTVVIMGGMKKSKEEGTTFCFRDVWHYSLLNYTWTHTFVDAQVSSNHQLCIVNAISVGQQVVVTFRSSSEFSSASNSFLVRYELWYYLVLTRKWIPYTKMGSSFEETFQTFVWRGLLFFMEGSLESMWYKKLVCPPGYTCADISKFACSACPVGFYATGNGETTGIPCPEGLTTLSTGSTSLTNCSQCFSEHCVHGVCRVFLKEGSPVPFCQCSLGFSGSHCDNPKYILILLGIIMIIGLAVSGVVAIVRQWRKKTFRERSLLHHVQEFTNVWQIKSDEITQLEQIGVGGYGEVYRARYRDLFVAMKLLRFPTNDSLMWVFEREIKFMQTIRHPNIVLFLGAGKTNDDCPFIISEFVSRGSLRSLLDDVTQDIPTTMKIKFALDVARGMNFLHSLKPPRVHRDLKSDNLLVSEAGIVKVTDFGLGAQLVEQERKDRRHDHQTSCLPLLEYRHDTPCGQGASRWLAPELAASRSAKSFSTASDVYRYFNLLPA
jgi:hypothetical protein